MKSLFKTIVFGLLLIACKTANKTADNYTNLEVSSSDFVVAFGSCSDQKKDNKLWKEVLKHKPDVWIWGGDNIYSDTDDASIMQADYNRLLKQPDYKKLIKTTKIMATWDDHDFGLNDGGEEFHFKKESQRLFLDFLGVSKDDERRKKEGVYYFENIVSPKGTIKVIVLDTRYFRTALTDAKNSKKRYQPNNYGEGTILGDKQWQWLENQLRNSQADFNIIVSSIQFLSGEHGFETWANFPHEVDKLKQLMVSSKAKGVLIVSGDRHISEFSKANIKNLEYPLIDFTSSGLTHSYKNFKSEPNKYREGFVVSDLSFGVLKFNFDTKTVAMQMHGIDNVLQQHLIQEY